MAFSETYFGRWDKTNKDTSAALGENDNVSRHVVLARPRS
jgi:hypothetical protein